MLNKWWNGLSDVARENVHDFISVGMLLTATVVAGVNALSANGNPIIAIIAISFCLFWWSVQMFYEG